MNRARLTLIAATITTALSAGVFYTFSTAINPAFAGLSDANYILAMQAINRDIQNPIFFLSFFGAAVLLPLAARQHRKSQTPRRFKLLVIAAALYVVGVFGVTCAANVPLNDKLNTVAVQTSSPEVLASERHNYQQPWNSWHAVRTVTGVASLAVLSVALVIPETTKRVKE